MPDRASLERRAREWVGSEEIMCDIADALQRFVPVPGSVVASLTALLASVAREAAEDMRERCAVAVENTNRFEECEGANTPTWNEGVGEGYACAIRHCAESCRALPAEAPTETRP
jgi:hypothetical protein